MTMRSILATRKKTDDLICQFTSAIDFASRATLGKKAPSLRTLERLPGAPQMFGSFGSCAPLTPELRHGNPIVEWNPFSQRPYLDTLQIDTSRHVHEFKVLKRVIFSFVVLLHESMHVLLWEPFFVGRLRGLTKKQHLEWSIGFEGFCFFYGDIVVTPKIRTKFPDAEVVFTRSAISQDEFHPYRVFDALGIRDRDAILDVYLDAFVGRSTPVYERAQTNAYTLETMQRMYGYHVTSLQPTRRVYDVLREIGILDDFYERFCKVPGLPSLGDDALLGMLERDGFADYCRAWFRRGLSALGRSSAADIGRVRLRRTIQTRAYFAYQVRAILAQRLFVSANGRAPSAPTTTKLRDDLDRYLERLEAALACLADGGAVRSIERQIAGADAHYERALRRIFRRDRLWVSRRELILPRREDVARVTLAPGRERRKAVEGLSRFTLDRIKRRNGTAHLATWLEGERQLEQGRYDAAGRRFRQVLRAPDVLEEWSLPLESVHPAANQFRELLFVYE
jgi:hypothetical protein